MSAFYLYIAICHNIYDLVASSSSGTVETAGWGFSDAMGNFKTVFDFVIKLSF